MKTNPINLAVIGAGLIGQNHLKIIHANANCQIAAICDPNPAAAEIAATYDVPFYRDYASLLAASLPTSLQSEQHSNALDGAIIATPTANHTEVGIACAEQGLHILVEKPIAATVADADKLIEVAERCTVQVLVGHHRRHNPLVQAANAIVQGGQIGKLTAVSAHFLLKKPDDYFDVEWRTLRPGGGPALINMIHDIDNLRYICGEVRQVFAQMSSGVRGFEVEDALSVSISFTNGAVGTILIADTTPSPWSYEMTTGENPVYPQYNENCYHFCGTEGSLAFPQMTHWHYPNEAQAGWHHPLEQSHYPNGQDAIMQVDPLVEQVDHFCRVIRGEEAPLVSGQDGANSLAVVLAILESAETGLPVIL